MIQCLNHTQSHPDWWSQWLTLSQWVSDIHHPFHNNWQAHATWMNDHLIWSFDWRSGHSDSLRFSLLHYPDSVQRRIDCLSIWSTIHPPSLTRQPSLTQSLIGFRINWEQKMTTHQVKCLPGKAKTKPFQNESRLQLRKPKVTQSANRAQLWMTRTKRPWWN